MSATVIVDGDTVVITNTFSVSGTPTDPTAITVVLTDPDGDATTYTSGVDSEVTNPSTGVYTLTVAVDAPGLWQFVWTGTGTAADVEAGTFRVLPTSTVYTSVDELADYLKTSNVTVNDSFLALAVESASRAIDDFCSRRFYADATATARTFAPLDAYCLRVDDFFTTTGLVVKTDTSDNGTFDTTWSVSDYELEPLNGLMRGTPWPYTSIRAVDSETFPTAGLRSGSAEVTARWGWSATPAKVQQATLIKAGRIFLRKQSVTGVQDGFGEFGAIRITRAADPDVADLLGEFRRDSVVVA